jgi:uncharacterized surface protein with fasciclin (FAS1) repeats
MKNSIKNFIIIILALLFQACEELPLQKSFDFDENDHPKVQPPFNMTMFEFMSSRPEFSLMVEAVNRAGMIDVFNGGADDKTVLLLRNEAMTEFLNFYKHTTVANVPLPRLQNLLNYHVITTRFTQNDLKVQEFYTFQTLIPGENGRIIVWKWREYWEIRINSMSGLPGTRRTANVYLHNYEFTNGVGHQMQRFVQMVPH